MLNIKLHIINTLKTNFISRIHINNVYALTNTVNYGRTEGALTCGLISPKQKRHTIIYVALFSIFSCVSANFECISAIINNKLYLQDREILTLSIPALGTKISTFSEKVFICVSKFYININKIYANTSFRDIKQETQVVKSLVSINAEPFLKVEGASRKILRTFKYFKNEKFNK